MGSVIKRDMPVCFMKIKASKEDTSLRQIHSAEDIWVLVQEMGFLPLFQNEIKGFSIEEHTPSSLWFSDTEPGPWEWKGPVIRMGDCFYGKFFAGKAGYISKEWFPAFANYRRDGYDFDALYDDGKAARKDKYIYDTVAKDGSLLTGELKKKCNYGKGGNKGFETVITRLQMQTYLVVEDFEYLRDKTGTTYGWGVALTVMKPYGGGALLDAEESPFGVAMTVPQCLHYCLTRPGVACVLAGAHTKEQLLEAAAYSQLSEEQKDFAALLGSTPAHRFTDKCMYCGHCAPCTVGIDIASVNKFADLCEAQGMVPETVREHYNAMAVKADSLYQVRCLRKTLSVWRKNRGAYAEGM